MTRTSIRPAAAVGLVGALLLYVGCARTYETAGPERVSGVVPTPTPLAPTPPDAASGAPDRAVAPPSEPIAAAKSDLALTTASAPVSESASSLAPAPPSPTPATPAGPAAADPLARLAAWQAAPPSAVLVVSGEQNGYLQPCGCTGGQLGGVGRRLDLITKLKGRGWPVGAVDLGNLIANPAGSRGGPVQEKIKFDTAVKTLAMMNYGAVAVGPEDLKLGVLETLGKLLNVKSPRFVAANLKPVEDFAEVVRPSTVVTIGSVRVGVTAVLDPEVYAKLADPDKDALLPIEPPAPALAPVLTALEKESTLQVLLVQGPPELARTLAGQFPGFELVVSTAKFDDPDARPEVVNGGRTTIINVGRRGKYAGVVGLYPGRTPAVDFHLQPLEGGKGKFEQPEAMRVVIDDEFVRSLAQAGVVRNFDRTSNPAYPAGATYVGAESCRECHPNTFTKWASTKHAHAYDALTNPKRNREADAECVSCHTTGFSYTSGFLTAQDTPFLKGNQCENCHGPGSLHNAEPDNLVYRQPMVRPAAAWDKGGLCVACHNDENDPHFDFAKYYPQINHKGLDVYNDPKVHKGRPTKVARRAPGP